MTGKVYESDVEQLAPSGVTRSIDVGRGSPGSSHTGSSDTRSRDALGKLHACYGVAARGRPSSRRFFALTFAGIVSTITS